MSKLIIIPDVHGRSFWRKAVTDFPNERFIFLGDYLDPYPEEGVTKEEAFAGLKDIIAFKEQCPEKVILLLGNHDLHYLHYELEGSRFDRINAGRNEKFFLDHKTDFLLAYECFTAGRRYLFTHAGVGKKWLESYVGAIPEEAITAEAFNNWYKFPSFIRALACVSYFRWGPDEYGSMVWADIQEQGFLDNQLSSIVQVFGHTMVMEPFNHDNRIYGLDCQKCFYMDLDTGGIYDLDSGMLLPTVNER